MSEIRFLNLCSCVCVLKCSCVKVFMCTLDIVQFILKATIWDDSYFSFSVAYSQVLILKYFVRHGTKSFEKRPFSCLQIYSEIKPNIPKNHTILLCQLSPNFFRQFTSKSPFVLTKLSKTIVSSVNSPFWYI